MALPRHSLFQERNHRPQPPESGPMADAPMRMPPSRQAAGASGERAQQQQQTMSNSTSRVIHSPRLLFM